MNLPNATSALVEQRKVLDYLLNLTHPEGAGKAGFFIALGFTADNWEALASALRQLAIGETVTQRLQSIHGDKFVMIGSIKSPSGKIGGCKSDLDC